MIFMSCYVRNKKIPWSDELGESRVQSSQTGFFIVELLGLKTSSVHQICWREAVPLPDLAGSGASPPAASWPRFQDAYARTAPLGLQHRHHGSLGVGRGLVKCRC